MTTADRPTSPVTTSVEDAVMSLIRDRLDLEIDDPTVDLFDSGIIDSLAFVTLLQALEERFGFTIAVEELDVSSFSTVDGIVAYVARRALPRDASDAGRGPAGSEPVPAAIPAS